MAVIVAAEGAGAALAAKAANLSASALPTAIQVDAPQDSDSGHCWWRSRRGLLSQPLERPASFPLSRHLFALNSPDSAR
jgi:hypothetical protein